MSAARTHLATRKGKHVTDGVPPNKVAIFCVSTAVGSSNVGPRDQSGRHANPDKNFDIRNGQPYQLQTAPRRQERIANNECLVHGFKIHRDTNRCLRSPLGWHVLTTNGEI